MGENANIHELLKSYLVARGDAVFGHRVFESKLLLSKVTHHYTLLLIKKFPTCSGKMIDKKRTFETTQ